MVEGDDSLYLYCVTFASNSDESFGPIGIGQGGDEVRSVASDGIGIVVSVSPRIPFAEIPPEQTLRHLAAHQLVIERVMEQSSVIPIKFGTYADGEKEVTKILQNGRYEFEQALERLDGKSEMDVAVTWPDLSPVFEDVAREEPIKRLKSQISRLAADHAVQQKIRLGQLVKERLEARRNRLAGEILAVLRYLATDYSANGLKDDSMILNVALLLDRGAEEQLYAKAGELDERFEGKLHFRCVGPLPPYSFATAEIKGIDAETLDAALKVLELPDAVSFNEVKEAHRRLARRFHPDSNPGESAPARLKEAGDAFKLLEQYCHNVKHSFARAQCPGLTFIKIRKLSELKAEVTAAS